MNVEFSQVEMVFVVIVFTWIGLVTGCLLAGYSRIKGELGLIHIAVNSNMDKALTRIDMLYGRVEELNKVIATVEENATRNK